MSHNQAVYGLIGYPIEHSRSPKLFAESSPLRHRGGYRLFPLKDIEDLPELIQTYRPRGLNVTSPYKESVLQTLKALRLSCEVERIGAANVLSMSYDGGDLKQCTAYNTDVYGFAESLRPLVAEKKPPVIILGTGGAARAVALALESLGWERGDYSFISRQPLAPSSRMLHFLQGDDALLLPYEMLPEVVGKVGLVINASPVGLSIGGAPLFPYEQLTSNYLCYDLNYSEVDTPFLQHCRAYGARCVNGAEMLRLQAEASWAIWHSDFGV